MVLYDKKFVTLSNNETIAYLEKGEGEQTLVLIHGNLSSSIYFKPLLQRMPEDIKVFAIDLRGFGDSTYNTRAWSLKDYAKDVCLFLDEMNIKKASILGWSLGGGVAMEFAAMFPNRIEKLILMNSTTHLGYPIVKKNEVGQPIYTEGYASPEEMENDPIQVKPVLNAIRDNNMAFLKYIYELTIYVVNKPQEKDMELYLEETMKQRNLADVDFALASLNMGDVPNLYSNGDGSIQNIVAPSLHIWGEKDITVLETMVLQNVEALKTNARYVKYDNCGHSPLVDKPNELVADLLDFLNQ